MFAIKIFQDWCFMPCGMLLKLRTPTFFLSFPITPSAMRWIQQLEILLMEELPKTTNLVNEVVFTISADAGFLPSTVSQQLSRLRYFKEILPKHQESGWWTWTFTRLSRLYQTLTIPESLPKRYGMEYLRYMAKPCGSQIHLFTYSKKTTTIHPGTSQVGMALWKSVCWWQITASLVRCFRFCQTFLFGRYHLATQSGLKDG